MSKDFDLEVVTRGGVQDLARVVGVWALLDLTPVALHLTPQASGLKILARFVDSDSKGALCAARLASQFAVLSVRVDGLSHLLELDSLAC